MTQTLPDAVEAFSPTLPVSVAFSGGADSTALLLACCKKWPGQVSAIHVHHGLQAAANDFQSHCEVVCARLKLPLSVIQVDATASLGQSPEDAARIARYGAFKVFSTSATGHKTIALAQHADDQVETVLLALSRGAGLAGLSGMPKQWRRDGIDYHRPLLGVAASDIRAWLSAQGEGFVEDSTNTDLRFTRNRIRAQILPALAKVFPSFRDTFARSAAHAAQAQVVLREIGQQDLAKINRLDDAGLVVGIVLKPLQTLSCARQANVLRHWLKSLYGTTPSTAQLDELLDQVAACTTRGHKVHLKVGVGFALRKGDILTWYNSQRVETA